MFSHNRHHLCNGFNHRDDGALDRGGDDVQYRDDDGVLDCGDGDVRHRGFDDVLSYGFHKFRPSQIPGYCQVNLPSIQNRKVCLY